MKTNVGKYVEISESEVPARTRLSTPMQEQGQSIERAYGAPGLRREGGYGDKYMSVVDRTIGPTSTKYYRWVVGRA